MPALLTLVGAPAIALKTIEGVADELSSFAKLARDGISLRRDIQLGGSGDRVFLALNWAA